jgi:nucleoside-diphosphate-sugar epimerase
MSDRARSEFSVREVCDISKARRELGFDPTPSHDVIAATLRYLAARSDSRAHGVGSAERADARTAP